MKFTSIIGVLIAAVAITFAFQNNEEVTVHFFSWVFTGSVALLILAALLVGFVVGMIFFLPGNITAIWRLRKIEKENEALKKEIGEGDITYEAPGLGTEGDINLD